MAPNNSNDKDQFVTTKLNVRATASLNEEVEKDLKQQDPDKERANAQLSGSEEVDREDS